MQDNNIKKARCYGITITADATLADGTTVHNSVSSVLKVFMDIVQHYEPRFHVRWCFQSERGNKTHRLHYQCFIDFGCAVKQRTVKHWMPDGIHIVPVQDTPADMQRAAAYCMKDFTRCADNDPDLDRPAGPYSYGFDNTGTITTGAIAIGGINDPTNSDSDSDDDAMFDGYDPNNDADFDAMFGCADMPAYDPNNEVLNDSEFDALFG